MKVKVAYLTSRPGANGRVRWYWQPSAELRRHGYRLIRLPDSEAQAIAEAQRRNAEVDAWRRGELPAPGAPRISPGTIADIIRRYKISEEFAALRPKTRTGYDWCLKFIEDWAGDRTPAGVGALDVKTFYRAMRKRTPAKANAVLTMLRTLLGWAISEELAAHNPAAEVRKKGVKPQPRPQWSRELVAAIVATADAMGRYSVGTAVLLNSWCGQRLGDVLAFARPRIAGSELRLSQSKTGVDVVLPIDVVPALVTRLKEEEERRQARLVQPMAQTLIISEETGQPYAERNFAEWIERIREAAAAKAEEDGNPEFAAALRGLVFQRLRAHAVVELYLAGCDFGLIHQITGHTAKAAQTIIDHYLPQRRDLAEIAFKKRLEREGKPG